MSFKAARNAINEHISQGWATPIAWDNVQQQNIPPDPPVPWVRVTVQPAIGSQVALGTRIERTSGSIIVQGFVPQGTATAGSDDLVDAVAARLRLRRIPITGGRSVRTRAATINRVGNDGEGWYQQNVVVPFQFDAES